MKTKLIYITALALIVGGSVFAEPKISERQNAELTVYNQNFALVKETRTMDLNKGINYVSVLDVAGTINPSTVALKSLSDPNSLSVREQNYQYALINPSSILSKSIGQKVVIRRTLGNRLVETEGTLLSSGIFYNEYADLPQSNVVIQTDSGVIVNPIGEIEVVELPKGLISKPTLEWKLESSKAGTNKAEISYIANKMTWIADYVAIIDANDENVNLTGWVTLTNNSGTTYENAALNLMAGDVNVVRNEAGAGYEAMDSYALKSAVAAPQFQEKSFFEYHLYTLDGKTTVKDKESKQISLLTADKAPAKKVYIYDGRSNWWGSWRYRRGYRSGESYDISQNTKVNIQMEIKNTKENNLGLALPKGTIRVYKQEESGNQHFVGEDTIDHTPKDETIRLYLGDAFDIVGEHKRTSFKQISNHVTEESFEISLRNHKDTEATITVVEHQFGDWKVTQSSHEHEKKDASTLEFSVPVPKDAETKVTYTVRTEW